MPDEHDPHGSAPEPASFALRLRAFLLPDRLRPPAWPEFRARWLALLAVCAAWVAGIRMPLWPSGEIAALLFTAAWAGLLLLAGVAICGPRRFAAGLSGTGRGSMFYHVVLVTAVLIAAGIAIRRLTSGPVAAPAADALPDKALVCAKLLSEGLLRPAAEEFAFRFVLFRCLRTRMSFPWAALLSSAAFGAVHLGAGAAQVAAAFVMGFLMCWILERTRSIAAPVWVHVINNLLAVRV